MINLRLPDELAAGFDAVAGLEGGRSALLRRLIADAVQAMPRAAPDTPRRRLAGRVTVRLAAPDLSGVDREAALMSLSRAAWIAALVRRRLRGRPAFRRAEELALFAIQVELRRIGVNINQIARAMNTAVMEGRVLESELVWIRSLRAEMRAHIGGLREAFDGNLAYWEAL